MQLLSKFQLNPYRVYSISKKTNKGIAAFPRKPASSYLDYTVDFSRRLQKDERILSGNITVNTHGLTVTASVCNGSYLTAFIDEGKANNTYYLTYEAQTNLGSVFIQDMVLPVTGKERTTETTYSFLSFKKCNEIKPPDKRPPLNAININDRYLLNDNGFFMVI